MPRSFLSSSLVLAVLSTLGCAPAPRPEPRSGPPAAATSATPELVAPKTTSTPETSAPETSAPSPPPPMRALAATDAFYIMAFPLTGRSVGPSATVCGDDAACRAIAPDDKGEIRRAFGEESWVVIKAPAGHLASVAVDGRVAAVTLQPQCPSGTQALSAQIVLYRVAKSVTATSVTVTPRPGPCPKAP